MARVPGEFTHQDAKDIIENEGIGYAVKDYCSGKDFRDPVLGEIWDAASATLEKLERYLEEGP